MHISDMTDKVYMSGKGSEAGQESDDADYDDTTGTVELSHKTLKPLRRKLIPCNS